MWEGWSAHNGAACGAVRITFRDSGTTSQGIPRLYTDAEWATPRLRLPWRDYLLLTGPLDAAGPITQYDPDMPQATQSPALIWPADHAWVVATEIDFDSTLLAGTTETITAVLNHPALEAYPVRPSDSLQHDVDHTNP